MKKKTQNKISEDLFTLYDNYIDDDILDEDEYDQNILNEIESIPESELNQINKELGLEDDPDLEDIDDEDMLNDEGIEF